MNETPVFQAILLSQNRLANLPEKAVTTGAQSPEKVEADMNIELRITCEIIGMVSSVDGIGDTSAASMNGERVLRSTL